MSDPIPSPVTIAPGVPGAEPRWTHSAKEGIGTAYHTAGCRLWFTLSHGIVNEVYCLAVDTPNTRDLQFLITDGETFVHQGKRDLHHAIEMPERGALFYRLTNSEPNGRYCLVKHILADPHHSALLVHTRLEIMDRSLRGKLRLFALLAHGDKNFQGVVNSVAVLDAALKRDLPGGPCWRRYPHDGYGQRDDGGAFDNSTGVGRWRTVGRTPTKQRPRRPPWATCTPSICPRRTRPPANGWSGPSFGRRPTAGRARTSAPKSSDP